MQCTRQWRGKYGPWQWEIWISSWSQGQTLPNQFHQQICISVLQRNEIFPICTWSFLHLLPDITCLWMVSDIIWIPEKINSGTCGVMKIWRWWYWTETFRLWMVHWVGKRMNTESFIILSISTCPINMSSLKSFQNFTYIMSP